MPNILDLTDLSDGQRAGIELLVESLAASHVPESARERLVADRLLAYRTRNRERALNRWGSVLEQKAAQAHADYERAGHLRRYSTAVRERRALPPAIPESTQVNPRYWLGYCLRCEGEMRTFTHKPRVPICVGCRR